MHRFSFTALSALLLAATLLPAPTHAQASIAGPYFTLSSNFNLRTATWLPTGPTALTRYDATGTANISIAPGVNT
jgi:hypothetical protein